MNNNSSRQERIFKIFTPVRCLNRDQSLRYLSGNMTDVEKHLIDQHLVDCDLCHESLQILADTHQHEPYERLSHQLSLFLQREYAPQARQTEQQIRRTKRNGRTKEGLISSFWVVMFVVVGIGGIFLLRQHLKNRPLVAATPQKTEEPQPAPAGNEIPAVREDETYKTVDKKPVTSGKPPAILTQYNTKDTAAKVKKTPAPVKDSASLKKKAAKDTIRKTVLPVTDTNTRTKIETAEIATQKVDPPKEEKTTPPVKPTPAEEKDTRPVTDNLSGDEFLYRTALRYQQQGDISEAISQFKRLSGNDKYSERAKYQLALCYRTKGQNNKARRLFREVIRMEGSMKSMAQAALDNMN